MGSSARAQDADVLVSRRRQNTCDGLSSPEQSRTSPAMACPWNRVFGDRSVGPPGPTGPFAARSVDDLRATVYPTGPKISDAQLAALPISPDECHGEWSYHISMATQPRRRVAPLLAVTPQIGRGPVESTPPNARLAVEVTILVVLRRVRVGVRQLVPWDGTVVYIHRPGERRQ